MRSDRPVSGALLWMALGFLLAGMLVAAYLTMASPKVKLDDRALDERARTGAFK